MMSRKKAITRGQVLKAIDGSAGVMLTISKKCGASYNATWRFFNDPENADLKELLKEEREKLIDVAENKLFKKVNEEDSWAIKYVLSTIGANRGYQEKQQIEHFGNKDINITFNEPSNKVIRDVRAEAIKPEHEIREIEEKEDEE